MSTVPSWVPIAAVATIVLGLFAAPLLARRQENGKLQANDEAELRTLGVDLRSDVVHAHGELHRNSTYVSDAFTGQPLIDFTAKAVGLARNLPPSRQRKVVTALVVLVGRWRIELAEDIGPTWLRSRTAIANGVDASLTPTSGLMDEQKLEFVMANHKALALRAEVGNDGLLGKMRTAQLPGRDPVATQSPRAPVNTARRRRP